MPDEDNAPAFVRSKLPWILGAAALVVFYVTLNHWINLRSLPVVAKVTTEWQWTLPAQNPLFYLVTWPIRWFSPAIQPLALNIFSVICGALTIALLSRSVALLPHDRTHEQRLRERSEFSLLSSALAWAPLVLAAGAFAFELTFWENATSASGEILDILVFAYLIRCLLEYRVSQRESWLSRMAFIYGLGLTNNWALIGFFPLFLGAVIWIRGLRFFEPGFLMKMAVLGLAGLLLYFFLPILWSARGDSELSFFKVLRLNWASQKMLLADTPNLRNRAFLLGLTSVLPVILMGIRWPSSFGDTSVAGASLTNLAFRVIHLFFLAACLFVVFDSKYSPRQLGLGLPFLSFYYLGALAIGYYSGYALLVFTDPPRKSWRSDGSLGKLLNPVVRYAVLAVTIAIPAALVYRNFGSVRANNGTLLKEFVTRTADALPNEPAYLLSEDGYQRALLDVALSARGDREKYVLVDTRALTSPLYHEQLHKHYGSRWPLLGTREEMGAQISEVDVQSLVRGLAATNLVIYLHPSFGYFFEAMYSEAHGQIYTLKPFARDQIFPPVLSEKQMSDNTAFWQKTDDYLKRIENVKGLAALDAQYIARYYSRAMNTWGVQLQRNEKIQDAGRVFAFAASLNTNNVPAKYNREFNSALQKGETAGVASGKSMDERFGIYTSWDAMLRDNGPFDHPEFCTTLGEGFLSQGQYRQAALQFSRVKHFQPTNFLARLSLATALIYGNWVDKGLAEILATEQDFKNLSPSNRLDLVSLRAAAELQRNDFAKAEALLKDARAKYPEETGVNRALFDLYRVAGQYTNALAVIDDQLKSSPTNIPVLLQKADLQINHDRFKDAQATLDRISELAPKNVSALLFQAFVDIQQKDHDGALLQIDKVFHEDPENIQALTYQGIIYMEQKQFDKARTSFDRVLNRQPENVAALRNRAILNLRAERWADAKDDYEHLMKLLPRSHAVVFGLAEIAYNEKDYKEAARWYQAYLRYAPAQGTPELEEEKKKVEARLKELRTAQK